MIPKFLYVGRRTAEAGPATVAVRPIADDKASGELLNPRHDIRNHSPEGFQWGYGGSGPAQLALALCVDALLRQCGRTPTAREVTIARQRAEVIHQDFKAEYLAGMRVDSFKFSDAEIVEAIVRLERIALARETKHDAAGYDDAMSRNGGEPD